MHSAGHNWFRSLSAIVALVCAATLILGCGAKSKDGDPSGLVDEIDAEIAKLETNYKSLKSATPELGAAILEGPQIDMEAVGKAQASIDAAVSKSEISVALVESNLLKLEEMKGAENYKSYVEKEKGAQEKRKEAWADVKLWWDGYESALQAASSIGDVGRFFVEEFGAEYEKAAGLVEDEDWQAGIDALRAADRQLRTQADALDTALGNLRIEGAKDLTDALDIFGEMIRLSIEFCDAGIAKDDARQQEIAEDIEASRARINRLEIDTAGLRDEIKEKLKARGADFDFAKADKLIAEAKRLEEKAQAAKPRGGKS